MKRIWLATATVMALSAASAPAYACRIRAQLDLNDVKYADVVLLGRISNYRIVRDVEFRRQRLANPKISPDMRKILESAESLLPDYARFDVKVDQVLFGKASTTISVTWDNSTFSEPEEMAAGPFLIALRLPTSRTPPLRGPSATIRPNPAPGSLTMLQAPCSSPFMFESASDDAQAVRMILGRSK